MEEAPRRPDLRRAHLAELTKAECFELLRTIPLGRVAVSAPPNDVSGAPIVEPVAYVVDGETIVYRTQVGAKVASVRQGPSSFEVDSYDQAHHVGWSVLLRGAAYEALPGEVEHLDLAPWAPGPRDIWIRLVPAIVTGRRLMIEGDDLDWRGYL